MVVCMQVPSDRRLGTCVLYQHQHCCDLDCVPVRLRLILCSEAPCDKCVRYDALHLLLMIHSGLRLHYPACLTTMCVKGLDALWPINRNTAMASLRAFFACKKHRHEAHHDICQNHASSKEYCLSL